MSRMPDTLQYIMDRPPPQHFPRSTGNTNDNEDTDDDDQGANGPRRLPTQVRADQEKHGSRSLPNTSNISALEEADYGDQLRSYLAK